MRKAAQWFAVKVCDARMFNQRTKVWSTKSKKMEEANAEVILKKLLKDNSGNRYKNSLLDK